MNATIKVLSYNIHKGFSFGKKSFVLSEIKKAIRSVQADLVFLQEVLGQHDKYAKKIDSWPTLSQFEFLADEIWPHFAYGKNAVLEDRHHGNAILSKFPIQRWSNIDVSTNEFEHRGLLHAVIGTEPELHCVCVHLGLLKRCRTVQIERLGRLIQREAGKNEALLLAGDFNDWSLRATQSLAKSISAREAFQVTHGKHPRTFPSKFPLLQLDRIYFRSLRVRSATVLKGKPWSKLSDHAALFAEFEMEGD